MCMLCSKDVVFCRSLSFGVTKCGAHGGRVQFIGDISHTGLYVTEAATGCNYKFHFESTNKLSRCVCVCVDNTQWELGLWHNTAGMVAAPAAGILFQLVRFVSGHAEVRQRILLLTMTADGVVLAFCAELSLQSRITAPNAEFEQTS